jgi:hypothetical protein
MLQKRYTKQIDAKFWLERWEQKEIGFHKKEVHPGLLFAQNQLNLMSGQICLVPLCGKSLDLLWFARQGLKVVGVELSSIACKVDINPIFRYIIGVCSKEQLNSLNPKAFFSLAPEVLVRARS